MKKLFSIAISCLIAFSVNAQITEKQVTKGGYGNFKKAPKKVYINSFNVYFQVYGSASVNTVGGPSLGGGGAINIAMGVMLEGVDSEDFIAITNKVYNDYVENLKKNGFEIITAEEAGKTEALKDWTRMEGGGLNQAQAKGYVKVTPQDYAYFVKRETNKGKEKTGFFGPPYAQLSKELGDAIIADVNFNYNFLNISSSKSELINYASMKATPDFYFSSTTPLTGATDVGLCGVLYSYGKNLHVPAAQMETYVKKNIYSEKEVLDPKQKVKEFEGGGNPSYTEVIFDTRTVASHTFTCNPALYKSETERMMAEVLQLSLNRLVGEVK